VSRPPFVLRKRFVVACLPVLSALALAACGESPREEKMDELVARAEAAAQRAEAAQTLAERAAGTASKRANTIAAGTEDPAPADPAPSDEPSPVDQSGSEEPSPDGPPDKAG
jgi:hypothetical protein